MHFQKISSRFPRLQLSPLLKQIVQETRQRLGQSSSLKVVLLSVLVTGFIGAVEQSGGLESLELRAYDLMIRLRPDEGPDPRLLIVEITETDLRSLNRGTPSDRTMAQLINRLQQHRPRAIGMDLHRDLPQEPGNKELQKALNRPNIVAITKLGDTDADRIPPPAYLAPEQVGFNDVSVDRDGVIRRNLMVARDVPSFSYQLALTYLEAQNVSSQPDPNNPDQLQIGSKVFIPIIPHSGGYQQADTQGYQVILNYRSGRSIARHISLSQVLNGEFKPEWIKDKVVLIGTTAVSGKDYFYTPYSPGKLTDHQSSGIAIHAQMVSQLLSSTLDQRPLISGVPLIWEWGWLLFWALAGGALVWRQRGPLMLAMTITVVLLLLSCMTFGLLVAHALWLPFLAPALTSITTISAVVAYRAQQMQQQNRMAMILLGQNTSKEVALALWKNRDRLVQSGKLPGQRLTGTMMFTDLKGFSTISEQLTPEALLDWLNEYLSVMTEVIHDHSGIVNKFTGDGVFAAFGVPIPSLTPEAIAQDASRAVACAVAMGDRLAELNDKWIAQGLQSVWMRVGICTGDVVVGSLGGPNRMEYGIIGDTVNIASRLESCSKERQTDVCRVLISGETQSYLTKYATYLPISRSVESWGEISLKGKHQQVAVYRILSSDPEPRIFADAPLNPIGEHYQQSKNNQTPINIQLS